MRVTITVKPLIGTARSDGHKLALPDNVMSEMQRDMQHVLEYEVNPETGTASLVLIDGREIELFAPSGKRCPHDGGKCHHGCQRTCFRERGQMNLTTPWKGYPLPGHRFPADGRPLPQLDSRHGRD